MEHEELISPKDPRVAMAAERTLLAWIRTGLSMMGFGFVVARFGLYLSEMSALQGNPTRSTAGYTTLFGILMVFVAVCAFVLAAWNHAATLRRIARNETVVVSKGLTAMMIALALAAIGIAMVISLVLFRG